LTADGKTRSLTDWAFFTILIAIIGLAGFYLPPLYIFAAMLIPLPAALLVLKGDMRYGILGLAAAGLILTVTIQPNAAFILVFQYGLLGVLYGLFFKDRASSAKILSMGMLYAVVSAFLYVALNYFITGNNLLVLGEADRDLIVQMMAAYRDAGMFNDIPPEWQGSAADGIISTFELFIPGQYVVSTAALSAVTYFLARACLQRLNYFLAPRLVFTAISLPWYSIWGLITGLALTLAGDHFSWLPAAQTGKNLLFVLSWLYLVLGLSVAVYFFRKINIAWPIKLILLVLALAYLPFSMVVVILLGVTDPLVNFRRLPA
jgi:uncharacterized protein YybS (DUF2232 family)